MQEFDFFDVRCDYYKAVLASFGLFGVIRNPRVSASDASDLSCMVLGVGELLFMTTFQRKS